MLQNYRSYLDYKELRRRAETKLSKSRHVLIHALLFLIINAILWYATFPQIFYVDTADNTYIPGLITTGWSFVLVVHALWSYFHSGFWPGKREARVEAEMSGLLENQSHQMDNDDFFQIHRMLDEDIRQRAGYQFSLSMFAIANAFLWAIWLLTGSNRYSYMTWYALGLAAFIFLLGGGILNFWRSGQREQKRMETNRPPAGEKQPSHESRYFATPEHGRLEIVEDDSPLFEKRKR